MEARSKSFHRFSSAFFTGKGYSRWCSARTRGFLCQICGESDIDILPLLPIVVSSTPTGQGIASDYLHRLRDWPTRIDTPSSILSTPRIRRVLKKTASVSRITEAGRVFGGRREIERIILLEDYNNNTFFLLIIQSHTWLLCQVQSRLANTIPPASRAYPITTCIYRAP